MRQSVPMPYVSSRAFRRAIFLLGAAAFNLSAPAFADSVWLSSLDLEHAKVTDGVAVAKDKSVDGKSLTINKKQFEHGVSVNGDTVFYVQLGGGSDSFSAVLGFDDESSVTLTARGRAGGNGAAVAGAAVAGRGAAAGRGGRGGRGRGAADATSATTATAARGQRGGNRGGGRGGFGGGVGGGTPQRAMSVRILADEGKSLYENTALILGSNGVPITVDTKGVKLMVIIVGAGSAGGGRGGRGAGAPAATGVPSHYDLAEAKFEVSGAKPAVIEIPGEARVRLTPPESPAPRINGPSLTGVSPGHPVMYKIPVSGTKPIEYAVGNLPAGLSVDAKTGVISGTIKEKGTYAVTLRAKNAVGEATREFKIVANGQLSLTPALGWNSWNAYGWNVSDAKTRVNVDAMVDKGFIDHGWTYINLDDGWERSAREGHELNEGPTRDDKGNILPNKKFPDMKALGEYIHSKGLKFGIYSSPGPTTCQGLEATFGHEQQDADTWTSWGVDYLKYDWCSYRADEQGLPGLKKPYQTIRKALDTEPRDIILSMCQYGNGNVWEWGAEPDIRGNSWRTTSDIRDNWPNVSAIGFHPGPRGSDIDLSQYAAPGHWNDPDMLVVGVVGWTFEPQHESKLTPAEQYTHITLWTLYPSPLMLGCDLSKADDFTIGLLTNDEVLAIHQDTLGKGAKTVWKSGNGNLQVWSRELADGSRAVGLFNLDELPMKVTAKWSDIGVSGKQTVRDVWRQKDLGAFENGYTGEIPRHGCMLIKVAGAK